MQSFFFLYFIGIPLSITNDSHVNGALANYETLFRYYTQEQAGYHKYVTVDISQIDDNRMPYFKARNGYFNSDNCKFGEGYFNNYGFFGVNDMAVLYSPSEKKIYFWLGAWEQIELYLSQNLPIGEVLDPPSDTVYYGNKFVTKSNFVIHSITVTSDSWGNAETNLSFENIIPICAIDQTEANNGLKIWGTPNNKVVRISGLPANVTHILDVYCIAK